MPIVGDWIPEMFTALDVFAEALAGRKRASLVVHCGAGVGKTGMTLACRGLHLGLSPTMTKKKRAADVVQYALFFSFQF